MQEEVQGRAHQHGDQVLLLRRLETVQEESRAPGNRRGDRQETWIPHDERGHRSSSRTEVLDALPAVPHRHLRRAWWPSLHQQPCNPAGLGRHQEDRPRRTRLPPPDHRKEAWKGSHPRDHLRIPWDRQPHHAWRSSRSGAHGRVQPRTRRGLLRKGLLRKRRPHRRDRLQVRHRHQQGAHCRRRGPPPEHPHLRPRGHQHQPRPYRLPDSR